MTIKIFDRRPWMWTVPIPLFAPARSATNTHIAQIPERDGLVLAHPPIAFRITAASFSISPVLRRLVAHNSAVSRTS